MNPDQGDGQAESRPPGDHRSGVGDLDQDTLDRRRRILGPDHPANLTSACSLAADLRALGEVPVARDLDQDTLDRRRRVLGEGHPETSRSAENLAADLRALAEADKDTETVINPTSNMQAG